LSERIVAYEISEVTNEIVTLRWRYGDTASCQRTPLRPPVESPRMRPSAELDETEGSEGGAAESTNALKLDEGDLVGLDAEICGKLFVAKLICAN
jgi:hypothetical protein